jgi:hypothetical protein
MKRLLALPFAALLASQAAEVTSPVPPEVRERFALDPFYAKCVLVEDFPVVSSAQVSDAALVEAALIVRSMLAGRDDILHALAKNNVRLAVMATGEFTCNIPEHSDLAPPAFWNRRARGLGATDKRPAVSCGEENLLHSPGDPYPTENILVHEFAHAIHGMALKTLDPTFDDRLKEAFKAALVEGKWKDCYAAENHHEYWAEAVQSWFDTNRENDAIHNHVNTREELLEYDPAVAPGVVAEHFGTECRYRRSDDPECKDERHLRDLDRAALARFSFPPEEES